MFGLLPTCLQKNSRYYALLFFYSLCAAQQPTLEYALALRNQGDIAGSAEIYRQLDAVYPTYVPLLYNYGHALKELSLYAQAAEQYNKVIELEPTHQFAHMGLAQALLAQGDFANGWPLFEWRSNDIRTFEPNVRYVKALYETNNLHNKKIVLLGEWGIGDQIQFIRFAKQLKQRGATIYLHTRAELCALFAQCPYFNFVFSNNSECPGFDVQVPLLSLAYICSADKSSLNTKIPYLQADPALVSFWQQQLAADTHFKIGICWQGNGDMLAPALLNKNISLAIFEPLTQIPGVSIYSLQKNSPADSLQKLHTFADDFDVAHGRFCDTAAVMQQLDLIITIDTSIAHLAGALGRPVWVLLPKTTDWRWAIDQHTSPWYATMQLFKQQTAGDYAQVMNTVVSKLKELIKKNKT